MNIHVTDEDRVFARAVFQKFLEKPGNEHIASETALQFLSACLRLFRPRTVLELGAGIGTVTDALLRHSSGVERVVATEQNEFCLSVLRNNLTRPDDQRLIVVSNPAELASLCFAADLVVGDGGFYSPEETACAREGTVFFVEGDRRKLRESFSRGLGERRLAIRYQEFGATRSISFGRVKVFAVSLPTIRHVRRKGCWIGLVKRAPQAAPSLWKSSGRAAYRSSR